MFTFSHVCRFFSSNVLDPHRSNCFNLALQVNDRRHLLLSLLHITLLTCAHIVVLSIISAFVFASERTQKDARSYISQICLFGNMQAQDGPIDTLSSTGVYVVFGR